MPTLLLPIQVVSATTKKLQRKRISLLWIFWRNTCKVQRHYFKIHPMRAKVILTERLQALIGWISNVSYLYNLVKPCTLVIKKNHQEIWFSSERFRKLQKSKKLLQFIAISQKRPQTIIQHNFIWIQPTN